MVRIILSLLLILQPNMAHANGNNSPVMGDYAVGLMSADTNFVINPIAEKNDFNKTTSSATATRDTDAADALYGKASWICDASAQNGYCEFTLKTITHPAQDGSCAAYIQYKGDASLYKLQILDGSSNVLSSSPVLTNASVWTPAEATYPCGSARQVRLTQTEAGTGAAVNLGVFYGKNQNIGTVAQATYFGGMSQVGAASCSYFENTSSGITNWVDLGTDADCTNAWSVDSAGTASGISAVGTTSHQISIANLSPGYYDIVLTGAFLTSTSGQVCYFRLSDGTNTYNPQATNGSGSSVYVPSTRFHVPITSTATKTYKIQASDTGAGSCDWNNVNTSAEISWKIYRYPSQSEQVVRMSQTNFDWTTCPTITLTNFGTTSNEVFKCRRVGSNLEMRGKFTMGTTVAAAASISIPYGAVSSSKGTTGVASYGRAVKSGGASAYIRDFTLLASPGDTTIKLGTLHNDQTIDPLTTLNGTQVGSTGQTIVIEKLSIPIEGWTENQNAPLIAGGVTTKASSTFAIYTAEITSGGVVSNDLSDFINGNCSMGGSGSATGTCTLTTGFFSADPTCWVQQKASAATEDIVSTDTTTQVIYTTYSSGGVATAIGVNIFCLGPQ